MSKLLIITLAIAAALGAAAFGIVRRDTTQASSLVPQTSDSVPMDSSSILSSVPRPIDSLQFIEAKRFASIWSSAKTSAIQGQAVAGVVNHHFLAADLMADFFTSLSRNRPDLRRFIILSPDHFFSGRGPISVHDRDYLTPDGLLRSDHEFAASLVSSTQATLENGAMFQVEHGVGALVPFIKHEFPEAKVVGIALQGSMDRDQARDFGRKLAGLADDRSVIIISSDMSHYLPADQALRNDDLTLTKLASLDCEFFSNAKDTHVDNGAAFVALAAYFGSLDIRPSFTLTGHGISSDYVSDDNNTTTYLNGIWAK